MRYIEPESIDAALTALADGDSRALAGGATLVAMLNEKLIAPEQLVGLRRIPELRRIQTMESGSVVIGAMCRHVEVAEARSMLGGHFVVREAAGLIAHPTIRNMGTIGGSIAHADPNADYPCALTAAGACVLIAGPTGRRVETIESFFVDYMETSLEPGELVVGIELPPVDMTDTSCYLKFSRVDGDYATVSIAVLARWSDQGECTSIRVAVGSCGPKPIRSEQAERILVAGGLGDAAVEDAAAIIVAGSDPVDDFRGSAEYRHMLVPGLLKRALSSVAARRKESPNGR